MIGLILSAIAGKTEVSYREIEQKTGLSYYAVAGVMDNAAEAGVAVCYNPDNLELCRWSAVGDLEAWLRSQQAVRPKKPTKRQSMWAYMVRNDQFSIADLVALGQKKNTVANYVKELRLAGKIDHLGRGIYSCRWEEVT
jgi:hypothetical protein